MTQEEKIKEAKRLYESANADQRYVLESLFPELKESEDERTWIINYLSNRILNSTIISEKENLKKAIAWLEKQGEQKHIPKHKVGDIIYYNSFGELKSMIVANVTTDSTDNPMYEDESGNAVFEKDLIEPKSTEIEKGAKGNDREIPNSVWSEEDEDIIEWLIGYLEYQIMNATIIEEKNNCLNAISMLKSLKERYTWKPSDEQMEAIDDFIYAKYPNIEKYGAAVKSLYQDLKKLIEA